MAATGRKMHLRNHQQSLIVMIMAAAMIIFSAVVSPLSAQPARNPSPRQSLEEPFAVLMAAAERLERVELPREPPGFRRRICLHRGPFKYPYLCVIDTLSSGPGDGSKGQGSARAPERLVKREVRCADHVMVKLPPGTDEKAFRELVRDLGLRVRKRLPCAQVFLISSDTVTLDTIPRLMEQLASEGPPGIRVEPDYMVEALETFPDDPGLAAQWAIHNTGQTGGTPGVDMDAPQAWDVVTGHRAIVVGVIDSGIQYTHPDLAENMWVNPGEFPGDGVDNDGNGYVDDVYGYDFVNGDSDPNDDVSHGTHIAGIIGAAGNNAEGVSGVTWRVSLMALKFLTPYGGWKSDALEALAYATANGAHLTSNCWGSSNRSDFFEQEIENARDHNNLFVVAAGNGNLNLDETNYYPASYATDNIISVAKLNHDNDLAYPSNYGSSSVHLSAPGEDVYSTVLEGRYGLKSGTSMAAPQVAGACALLLSVNPGMAYTNLKSYILSGVDPVPAVPTNRTTISGGRLNVANSLALVPAEPFVALSEPSIDDDSAGASIGNGDGFANPGETVEIALEVENLGLAAAANLTATLAPAAAADPLLTISGGTIAIGNLASNSQIQAGEKFAIAVDPSAATPHTGEFLITIQDIMGNSWVYDWKLTVYTSVSVSGYVRDGNPPGDPVVGATVFPNGPASGDFTTDASGFYSITMVDGGYLLTAAAPGYAPTRPLEVTVDQASTPIVEDLAVQRLYTFSYPGLIEVPGSGSGSGAATPYPSTIDVSGITGTITWMKVTLDGVTHPQPGDLDILLEGPQGQTVMLMSDVGGQSGVDDLHLQIVPGEGVPILPSIGNLYSGMFRATNLGAEDILEPPAPAPPHGAALDDLIGTSPNGQWKLYVYDDVSATADGSIGGWSFEFVVADTYRLWADAFFQDPTAAIAARLGDADRDGIVNLMEYALGLRPLTASREGLPQLSRSTVFDSVAAVSGSGGEELLVLTVNRQSVRSDIDYTVEVSSDLMTWQSGPPHTVTTIDTPTMLEVHDTAPFPDSGRRYMRLRVDEK